MFHESSRVLTTDTVTISLNDVCDYLRTSKTHQVRKHPTVIKNKIMKNIAETQGYF